MASTKTSTELPSNLQGWQQEHKQNTTTIESKMKETIHQRCFLDVLELRSICGPSTSTVLLVISQQKTAPKRKEVALKLCTVEEKFYGTPLIVYFNLGHIILSQP